MRSISRPFSSLSLLSAALIGAVALAGCGKAKQESLKSVKVPAGFTFATSHSVDINVTALASAPPPNGNSLFEMARADGKILYKGRIEATKPVHVKLAVPLKDAELIATLEGPNGARNSVKMPIENHAASYDFR